MTITIPEVTASRPDALIDAAAQLGISAEAVTTGIDSQRDNLNRLQAAWNGTASNAAVAKAMPTFADMQRLRDTMRRLQSVIRTGATDLSRTRNTIVQTADTLRQQGWFVAPDGSVSAQPGGQLDRLANMSPIIDMQLRQMAASNSATLKNLLAKFDLTDRQLDQRVRKAATGLNATKVSADEEQAEGRQNYRGGLGPRLWTDEDLFDGDPSAKDINQDSIGDCFFLSTLGAVANETPDRIRNGIKYDPATQSFTVTALFDGKNWTPITVTQDDIRRNIEVKGGSDVDNRGDGPVWPAVMEAAYAKMVGDGDAEAGYRRLDEGGWPRSAMQDLTGNKGTLLPGLMFKGENNPSGFAYDELSQALASNAPVTMTTGPAGRGDGVVDHHSYTVESLQRNDNGDTTVTVRNPWANNMVEGRNVPAPLITLNIEDLAESGALTDFTIGS